MGYDIDNLFTDSERDKLGMQQELKLKNQMEVEEKIKERKELVQRAIEMLKYQFE